LSSLQEGFFSTLLARKYGRASINLIEALFAHPASAITRSHSHEKIGHLQREQDQPPNPKA
jgi:hypothetical protein